ncbi:hypothetical protein [Isoptericola aurantiacus]|uniref:hypothetical protein n=1 Tax=Isoptericola aurantiacus TaxID=3377839 RepID=UPI00383BE502
MSGQDEAFDRLAAADPADGVETRHGVLRAKTDALAEGQGTGGYDGAADVPGTGAAAGEHGTGRDRRRTPWLVAAAAVVVVAVGGGGYALGAAASGSADVTPSAQDGQALPPISLDAAESGSGDAAEGPLAAAELGAEESAGGAGDAASLSVVAPGWSDGRTTFTAQGLSTTAGPAAAYAYDATATGTQDGAVRAADALGVTGEPRWEYGAWVVGPDDGTRPTVRVAADGTASFSYHDPAADPWACDDVGVVEPEGAAPGGGAADDGSAAPAVEQPVCALPESTIAADEAAGRLRDVMERLGVDPDGFELEASDDGEVPRSVTAHQVLDGARTGAAWRATFGGQDLAWLDGFLAATVPLGDYPVVSPAEAVDRLSDPRFGQRTWPIAYAATDPAGVPEQDTLPAPDLPADQGEPTAPPAPPSSGDAVSWPVRDVTITAARLGPAQQYQQDGSVLLLPAYELSDAAGNTWSVLAVAEDALDLTAP